MRVSKPFWNTLAKHYTFIISDGPILDSVPLSPPNHQITIVEEHHDSFLEALLNATKSAFATPLRKLSVKKRLRHTYDERNNTSDFTKDNTYTAKCRPLAFIISGQDFLIEWKVENMVPFDIVISENFLTGAITPRSTSPLRDVSSSVSAPALEEIRTVHIDDLPSDTISTSEETLTDKDQVKRSIRDARFRVALAKLKAERMEQRYYSRYGEYVEEDESESEGEEDIV